MSILLPGQRAPDFTLPDQYGIRHRLSHHRGMWVILCFLPNDFNSACIREACAVRDGFACLQDRHAEVFGINLDGLKAHAHFSSRYNLSYPLLSDKTGKVCEWYNALWTMGPLKIVRRHSVIINPTGDVVRIYRRVRPLFHGKQLIEDLDLLQQTFIPQQKASLAY